jgi:hypothetical protein
VVLGLVFVLSTPDSSSRYDADATAACLRATARVPLSVKISQGTDDNPPAGELLDVTHLGGGGASVKDEAGCGSFRRAMGR